MHSLHPSTPEGISYLGILQAQESTVIEVACTGISIVCHSGPTWQRQLSTLIGCREVRTLLEGNVGFTLKGWEVHLAGNIGYTIELYRYTQTLPLCSQGCTEGILWNRGVLIRSLVI